MKHNETNESEDVSAVQLADEVAEEVRRSVLEFIMAIRKSGSGDNRIITIDELEHNWDILGAKTQKTYARMIGDELSSINEKPMIDSKKESSQKGG